MGLLMGIDQIAWAIGFSFPTAIFIFCGSYFGIFKRRKEKLRGIEPLVLFSLIWFLSIILIMLFKLFSRDITSSLGKSNLETFGPIVVGVILGRIYVNWRLRKKAEAVALNKLATNMTVQDTTGSQSNLSPAIEEACQEDFLKKGRTTKKEVFKGTIISKGIVPIKWLVTKTNVLAIGLSIIIGLIILSYATHFLFVRFSQTHVEKSYMDSKVVIDQQTHEWVKNGDETSLRIIMLIRNTNDQDVDGTAVFSVLLKSEGVDEDFLKKTFAWFDEDEIRKAIVEWEKTGKMTPKKKALKNYYTRGKKLLDGYAYEPIIGDKIQDYSFKIREKLFIKSGELVKITTTTTAIPKKQLVCHFI